MRGRQAWAQLIDHLIAGERDADQDELHGLIAYCHERLTLLNGPDADFILSHEGDREMLCGEASLRQGRRWCTSDLELPSTSVGRVGQNLTDGGVCTLYIRHNAGRCERRCRFQQAPPICGKRAGSKTPTADYMTYRPSPSRDRSIRVPLSKSRPSGEAGLSSSLATKRGIRRRHACAPPQRSHR
jgi:hypothetical protein